MTSPPSDAPLRRHLAVALLVIGVVVVMLLTSGQMADLRVALPPLSRALSWLDRLPGPFDLYHVVFFALVATAMRVVLPRLHWWLLLVLLGVLAAVTELLQFATVGRTPRLLDVRDDMLGAGVGMVIGSLPLWFRGGAGQLNTLSRALLLAGIALLPFQQWPLGSVYGFPLLPADALLLLALALRAFAWAGGNAPMRIGGFHLGLAVYLGALLLAVLVLPPFRAQAGGNGFTCALPSPSFGHAVAKWAGVAWLVAIAALACDAARERPWRRRMLLAWLVGAAAAALAALVAIVGFYAGDAPRAAVSSLLSHYGSLPPGPYPRVDGVFANANMAGLFLLLSVGVALMAKDEGWLSPRHLKMVVLLVALPLLATASQAVGAAVLLLTWRWWYRSDVRRPLRGVVLAAGATVATAILGLLLVNPAAPFDLPSVRMQLWYQAWLTWQGAFWRGTGLGQPAASVDYLAPDGHWQHLGDAHNIVLNLGAQGGVVVVAAFLGLVVWAWWSTREQGALWGGRSALLLAVAYLGLGGSFEDARVLWVLLGMLAGAAVACAELPTSRASPA